METVSLLDQDLVTLHAVMEDFQDYGGDVPDIW